MINSVVTRLRLVAASGSIPGLRLGAGAFSPQSLRGGPKLGAGSSAEIPLVRLVLKRGAEHRYSYSKPYDFRTTQRHNPPHITLKLLAY